MSDDPISLDSHRGMAAQKATDIRRRLSEVKADQTALQQRQNELEQFLLSAPAATWRDAAEKARYLIGLFAATLSAQDRRHQELITSVLEDFDRLSTEGAEPPDG